MRERPSTTTLSRNAIKRVNWTYWPQGGGNLSAQERKFFEDFKYIDTRRTRNVAYVIYQEEIAPHPSSDRSGVHIQGFFVLYERKRVLGPTWKKGPRSGAESFFWGRVSYSAADYVAASRAYASKVETRRANGIHGEHGITPTDRIDTIDDAIGQIRRGASYEEVSEHHHKVMFHHRQKVKDAILNNRPLKDTSGKQGKFRIEIFVGVPGTGKTRTAKGWLLSRGKDFYCAPSPENGNLWFEGYLGQPRMIFNEMDDSWYKYQKIKKLMDGEEPFDFPRKGFTMQSRSDTLIFTTNTDPIDWYSGVSDRSAFERRVNQYCRIYDFELTCTCEFAFACTCGSHHSIKRRRYGPEGFKCGSRSTEIEPELIIDMEANVAPPHTQGHQSQQESEYQQNMEVMREEHNDLLTEGGHITVPSLLDDDDDILEDEPDLQAIPPVHDASDEELFDEHGEIIGE